MREHLSAHTSSSRIGILPALFGVSLAVLSGVPGYAGSGRPWATWFSSGLDTQCFEAREVSFENFEDSSSLRLNGSAAVANDELRLTSGAPLERGAAFLRESIPFGIETSFESHFVFRMGLEDSSRHRRGARADGLAFTLQSWSPRAEDARIFQSLAVELDTRKNEWDPNANHVGINLFGSLRSIRTASPGFLLADGQAHGVWVTYDADEQSLRVFVSEDPASRPSRPLLTVSGPWLTRLLSPGVFPGFTASSHARRFTAPQGIESWSFRSTYACNCATDLDCADDSFCNGMELCNSGACVNSTEPPCGEDACDETADECLLEPRRLEVGSVAADGSVQSVFLTESFVDPVIVATVQHRFNSMPVVARVSRVSATGFDLRIQNPSGNVPVPEIVNWIAVERGAWDIDGVRFEAQTLNASVTDFRQNWTGQTVSYLQPYVQPVVIGQVMTENDPRWSTFWSRGEQLGDPPSPALLIVGKSVAEDPQTDRADETIGIVIFEAGHGTIGGLTYEASVGEDTVQGVGDGAPFPYSFVTPFAATPPFAFASLAGVDGLGGGWAELFGDPTTTYDQIFLAIDEDQLADDERGHATEQVAYLAFLPTNSAFSSIVRDK